MNRFIFVLVCMVSSAAAALGDPMQCVFEEYLMRNRLDDARELVTSATDLELHLDDNGSTPLIIAASNGHIPLMRALLEHGAHVDTPDYDGYTALGWAISHSRMQEPVELLLEYQANVNHLQPGIRTPLMVAIQENLPQIANRLLDAGADANLSSHEGTTPLMVAVEIGSLNMVTRLLAEGARPEEQDRTGRNAFFYSRLHNRHVIERMLLTRASQQVLPRAAQVVSETSSTDTLLEQLVCQASAAADDEHRQLLYEAGIESVREQRDGTSRSILFTPMTLAQQLSHGLWTNPYTRATLIAKPYEVHDLYEHYKRLSGKRILSIDDIRDWQTFDPCTLDSYLLSEAEARSLSRDWFANAGYDEQQIDHQVSLLLDTCRESRLVKFQELYHKAHEKLGIHQ